ncbi:GPO family capsid scaffolding protein [Salinisphaera sp. USBA-960]|nr:GPO family capsid scaffolding protein [Salifodinibacter halophilus]NNC25316.1 GPO family capsid scaffolding protein [Salifodinibacter halophilus]
MAYKRIATEGNTTDGRTITRDWLTQAAEDYDPSVYSARIWMEHMRGMFADGPFPALGDVNALKTRDNADGKLELYADLDPTDQLKAMNKNRQKIFTSMELDHDFAGSGRAYLVGVGVTDTPASLGTEMLKFSAGQCDSSPLSGRKQKADNSFSAAAETDGDFETPDADFGDTAGTAAAESKTSLTEKVRSLFKRGEDQAAGQSKLRDDVEATVTLLAQEHRQLADRVAQMPDADRLTQVETKLDEVYAVLDNAPDQPNRIGTGSANGAAETDC